MQTDFDARFDASRRGRHAPGAACHCAVGVDGRLGTHVVARSGERPVWRAFEDLSFDFQRRMSCWCAREVRAGVWVHAPSGRPIHVHVRLERRRALRAAWRRATGAVSALLFWLKVTANATELARIRRIEAACRGLSSIELETILEL